MCMCTDYASKLHSELRKSNIFWITYDYLHILKHSLKGNSTIFIDKRTQTESQVSKRKKKKDFHFTKKIHTSILHILFSNSKISNANAIRIIWFQCKIRAAPKTLSIHIEKKRKSGARVPLPHRFQRTKSFSSSE